MSKYLNILQTLAKIGKILCVIVFVFTIIGCVGCLIGAVTLFALQGVEAEVEEILSSFVVVEGEAVGLGALCFACIGGMLICAAEAVLCKFAQRYFENELAAGTPFTEAGAKEMLRLGILSLAIPLGVSILLGISWGIFCLASGETGDLQTQFSVSGGMGVFFLILSAIFRYGAELRQGGNPPPTP